MKVHSSSLSASTSTARHTRALQHASFPAYASSTWSIRWVLARFACRSYSMKARGISASGRLAPQRINNPCCQTAASSDRRTVQTQEPAVKRTAHITKQQLTAQWCTEMRCWSLAADRRAQLSSRAMCLADGTRCYISATPSNSILCTSLAGVVETRFGLGWREQHNLGICATAEAAGSCCTTATAELLLALSAAINT